MTKHANSNSHEIHNALKKLKNVSNAQEIKLIESVASMYEQVKHTKDKALEKVENARVRVSNSVHLRPWTYMASAAVLGLLTGYLFRRHKK